MLQIKLLYQKKSVAGNHIKWMLFVVLLLLSTTSFSQFTKSGTVYEDYNGNRSANAGEPGTNAGGLLCAYLINNTTNAVLQTQPLSAGGAYSFNVSALSGASYIVAIGNCGIPTGTIFTGGTAS